MKKTKYKMLAGRIPEEMHRKLFLAISLKRQKTGLQDTVSNIIIPLIDKYIKEWSK